MLLYRIVHKNYSHALFASGLEGRWNSAGKKVIYCAESIALAFLENMVRRQGVGFNHDFRIMFIHLPENAGITEINETMLKKNWRNLHSYAACQRLGNQWYDEQLTLALKVPSAVLPQAFNYVINTLHPQYKNLELKGTTDLVPDNRIEDLLKKYKP